MRDETLTEKRVALLIQRAMKVHYDALRAEITGRSFSTGIGVWIKRWSRPAAFAVGMAAEGAGAAFGIAPHLGSDALAGVFGLVDSVLFGLGLMQVSKPGHEKNLAMAAMMTCVLVTGVFAGKNPELDRQIQTHFFELGEPAKQALVRVAQIRAQAGNAAADLAASRDAQKGATSVQGRAGVAAVKSAGAEVAGAKTQRDAAAKLLLEAERQSEDELARDPSRSKAILALAALFVSIGGGAALYGGRYLESAEAEHEAALAKSRTAVDRKSMLAHVREDPDGLAAEFFGAFKTLFVEGLRQRGINAEEARAITDRAFGEGEAIHMAAAKSAGRKYRPPEPRGPRMG